MSDRNASSIQAENVRLAARLMQSETAYRTLQTSAQQLMQQAQQLEMEKLQACQWLVALLLEHHQGKAVCCVPLVEELQKQMYGITTKVSENGLDLEMTAIDAEGIPVKAPSALELGAGADDRVGSKFRAIQAAGPVEPVEPDVICLSCLRKNGAHNLDCPNNAL